MECKYIHSRTYVYNPPPFSASLSYPLLPTMSSATEYMYTRLKVLSLISLKTFFFSYNMRRGSTIRNINCYIENTHIFQPRLYYSSPLYRTAKRTHILFPTSLTSFHNVSPTYCNFSPIHPFSFIFSNSIESHIQDKVYLATRLPFLDIRTLPNRSPHSLPLPLSPDQTQSSNPCSTHPNPTTQNLNLHRHPHQKKLSLVPLFSFCSN